MPDKLKQLQDLFYSEAAKYNVLPLDNTTLARWNSPRPNLTAGRTEFTYSGGLTGVPGSAAPNIMNKSYTITAEVEIPKGGAEGMIVTEGGRFGGYGLFLSKGVAGIRKGKVVFLYNLLDLKRTVWSGPELAPGKHTIVFDYKISKPGLGEGGTGVLSVDGKEVAKNSMEHGIPVTFPEDETFDIGEDTRTGVAHGGVSLRSSVQVHRQDRQADLQTRTRRRQPRRIASSFRQLRTEWPTGKTSWMKKLLTVTAVAEAATGVALVVIPSLVGQLLLGAELTGVAIPIARLTGIALISLGIACLPASTALYGMLTYSVLATSFLFHLAIRSAWVGPLLWPAIVLHAILTILLIGAWRLRIIRNPTNGTFEQRT